MLRPSQVFPGTFLTAISIKSGPLLFVISLKKDSISLSVFKETDFLYPQASAIAVRFISLPTVSCPPTLSCAAIVKNYMHKIIRCFNPVKSKVSQMHNDRTIPVKAVDFFIPAAHGCSECYL